MTNRISYAPQDFQKMCKQAERDQEAKKLVALMDRVKRQIAAQQDPALAAKPAGMASDRELAAVRRPSRTVPFER